MRILSTDYVYICILNKIVLQMVNICAKKAATSIGLKRCFNKNQFVLGQANIATFNSKEFTV